MKKIIRSTLSSLLALSLLLTVVGCGEKETSSDTSDVPESSITEEVSSEVPTIIGGDVNSQQGGSNAGTTSGSSTGNSNGGGTSAYPSYLRGTTLEVFNWNPASEYPELPNLIKKFEKDSGVKVKWTIAAYADYNVELAARVAANNAPDVVRFICANVAELELTQPLANSGYDFSGSEWDQQIMKYYTINGKAYATNRKNSLIGSPYLITYNKNLISQYDFEDPYQLWKKGKWTWETFIEMCQEFYKATGKQNSGCVMYKPDSMLLVNGYQGPINYENGRYDIKNLSDTKCVDLWKQCYTLNNDGTFHISTWDRAGFESGKYLFMENMAIHLRSTNPYFAEMKSDGILGVVPYPTIKGNSKVYTGIGEYEAYGIAKGAKNAKAVPYYLNYVLNSDNINKNKFFFSSETLEVYEYVMNNTTRVMHNRYTDGQMNSSKVQGEIWAFGTTAPAHLNTTISSNKSVLDSYVKGLNDRLSKLK